MNPPGPPRVVASGNDTDAEASLTCEARVLISCGLVVLFSGLFLAVFSDGQLGLFLGMAVAAAGALMALPRMVAAAISRR
ncbi:hypothetical protein [Nocardioides aurantiacus]|uniref:hypothetical protein n=1 Tax=Nocardioides aurantiacus TaxID=86796 RepID=UPI0011CE68E6|nr:hypothetical protein [Nocardioides aurantiacus]